ncbi:M15 family metallopeptidase [Rummeliibacillus pycnus]|uniref:M15 family metallopeptidase n=1 Tax=Rummeliibacillus pycnus TaxID=101070 RepID=UPI000C99985F|nr:M15 family metallopeptidase [Rummeliibacillus pycnus]
MKSFNNHIFITWFIILIFTLVVILSITFISKPQEEEKKYIYLGKNAPIPTKLEPVVEEMKNTLITSSAKQKIDVVITEGIRSFTKQDKLYQQGRTTPGKIVTNTRAGESYHNYGLAFDYALLDKNGVIIWDTNYDGNGNGESDWFEVADLAKKMGFDWGGDWVGFKDYPHLQMTFGLTIDMLKNGYRLNDIEIRKELKQNIAVNTLELLK